jgi:hypothetical protein
MTGAATAASGAAAAAGGELFKTVTVGNAGSETGYRAGSYGSITPNRLVYGRTLINARSLLLANFEIEFNGAVGAFTFNRIEVQNSAGSIITLLRTSGTFFTTGGPTFGWSWGDGTAGLWIPADAGTAKALRFY